MTKAWELEALKMKYEHPVPCVVKVSIQPSTTKDDIMSWGGFGYVKIYGEMTEQQRSKFISHIERYVKLLFEEAEKEVKNRREWDKYDV